MSTAIKQSVAVAVQIGQPALLWGPPGTGKTSFVEALALGLNIPCEVVLSSIREPSDFGGLPVIRKDKGVSLEPAAWALRLAEAKGLALCFLDEINTAPPAVQAALLRVTQEGVVGDLQLPDTVSFLAAANPPEHSAGGWTLAAPLANRFLHFDWDFKAEEWCDGAIEGWESEKNIPRLSPNWQEGIKPALSLVASYIKSRPVALFHMPKEETEAGKAWASPRTWEMTAKCMAAVQATPGLNSDVEINLVSAAIGNGVGMEFLQWKRELDLPDPEMLLSKKIKFKMPDHPDKTFAVLSSVVIAVINNKLDKAGKIKSDRWNAGWDILAEAAKQGSPDVAAFAARTLAKKMDQSLPVPNKQMPAFSQILKDAGIMKD